MKTDLRFRVLLIASRANRRCGRVPLNLAQGLMTRHCSNPLFGSSSFGQTAHRSLAQHVRFALAGQPSFLNGLSHERREAGASKGRTIFVSN